MGFLVLVGVFGATLGLLWWQQQSQPAFVINGKEYSRDEYNQMMASAEAAGVSKKDATKQYIDIEKKRAAAESLGIQPTQQNIETAAANLGLEARNDQTKLWEAELAYEQALEPAIDFLKKPGKKGAVFYFPYKGLSSTSLKAFYNPNAVDTSDTDTVSDKKYAKEQAEAYRQKVANGENTQQLVDDIMNNEKLALSGAANGSMIFAVNSSNENVLADGISLVLSSDDLKALDSLKEGEVSKIKTGYVSIGSGKTDSYFYFVKLDSSSKGDKKIEQKYSEALQDVEVSSNV